MKAPIILHVEDDDDDAFIFAKALRSVDATVRLHRVAYASVAVDYLKGMGIYADRGAHPVPGLILLDLRMPGMDGFDFLRWKKDSIAAAVPVICLSSALAPGEADRAVALGALMAIEKPNSFADLKLLAEELLLAAPYRDVVRRQLSIGR